MSNFLKSPNLLRRETPEALDRRILIAGAIAAAQHRRARKRRIVGAISGIAAAVAVAVAATWPNDIPSERQTSAQIADNCRTSDLRTASEATRFAAADGVSDRNVSEQELLEFSDWTTLEQENYNLASQLNCYQDIQENEFSSWEKGRS